MQQARLLLCFLTAASIHASAQCLSGNCQDGKGRYDFGWCEYEGEFKSGKADGAGRMKYSDYTYTGHFSKGVEDGSGEIAYTDGRRESVTYLNGGKRVNPKAAASGFQQVVGHDAACISGDCNNGFGTYQHPSGNKYTGSFKGGAREGTGTFFFANGEQLAGSFHNNYCNNGTYTFASGATNTGTYDAAGNPLNGMVQAGSRRVTVSNGKALIPKEEHYGYDHTDATRKAEEARGSSNQKSAPVNWSGSSGDHARQQEVSSQAADNIQKMLDRMDRPTYTHY